jgi:hypothetical protein
MTEMAVQRRASNCRNSSTTFPGDQAVASNAVLWNVFKRVVAGASADERAAIFGRMAMRVASAGSTSSLRNALKRNRWRWKPGVGAHRRFPERGRASRRRGRSS